MRKSSVIAAAILATSFSGAASAAVYTTTVPALSGFVSISGFADSNPNTYSVVLRDLSGSGIVAAAPAGNYIISVSGSASIDAIPPVGPDLGVSLSTLTPIFSGLLGASGLTSGNYPFSFSPGTPGSNDALLGSFGFTASYDGNTTSAALAFINNLLGTSFSSTAGAGTLAVSNGNIFSDGLTFDITETATGWMGFGALLAVADSQIGPTSPDYADATFSVRDLTITATSVPEPASLALLGVGLAGLGAVRRRKA